MKIKLTKNIITTASIIIVLIIAGTLNLYSTNKEFTVKEKTKPSSGYEGNEDSNKSSLEEIMANENDELNRQNVDPSIESNTVTVFISGEVLKPQVITIEKGKRLVDAIESCGGLTDKANLNAVNLALVLQEEQHYIIPGIGEEVGGYENPTSVSSDSQTKNDLIDINRSTLDMLKTLPGIGDVLAQRIIEKRDELGGFKSIDQLQDVSGIGNKKFMDIKDKVKIK